MKRLVTLSGIALLLLSACRPAATPPTQEEDGELTTIEAGKLTVGSDIPFEPFEFEGEDGELTGFDIDLITEVAERLDLEPEFVDTGFEGIFTQLAGGGFDVVASATTITEEREEQVNFTDPYFLANQALTINAAKTPDIESTDDLGSGHTVAVQEGTTGKDWAEENLEPKGVQVRAFPEAPDTYAALEAGVVAGVIFDEGSAVTEAKDRRLEIVESIDTGERYGLAVNPENQLLLEEMNRVLEEIISDGTYEEIFRKYPDLPESASIA